MIKSAASAASPEGLQAEKLDFQAMIKAAASAASRNPRGAQLPLGLGPWPFLKQFLAWLMLVPI